MHRRQSDAMGAGLAQLRLSAPLAFGWPGMRMAAYALGVGQCGAVVVP